MDSISQQGSRLVSLDVFRGMTVMFMIFVNNGAGEQIFSTLQHSKWNGMTPCDLVFPFFLFIMGVATYLSLKKTGFQWSWSVVRKVVKRSLLLFVIGLAINWFDMACDGRPFDLAHLRIMGVMQRIGLCYGITCFVVLALRSLSPKMEGLVGVITALLVAYSGMILMWGGYNYDAATNILAIVDRVLLGPAHLYRKSPVDPEGLLSTLPAIAHTLIGFATARWAFEKDAEGASDSRRVMSRFLLCGALMLWIGFLLSFGLPVNKRIWSPSFVLVSCGFGALAQGMLVYWIDLRRRRENSPQPLTTAALVFGTNPLLLYVVSEVVGIGFGAIGIKSGVYDFLHSVIANGYWASAVYASLFVGLHALLGYLLWKRRIFIKL